MSPSTEPASLWSLGERLLRIKFPLPDPAAVLERYLRPQQVWPRRYQPPITAMETLAKAAWQTAMGPPHPLEDAAWTVLFLAEDLITYRASAMAEADHRRLVATESESEPLPAYFHDLAPERLPTLLAHHGQRADIPLDPADPWPAYLLSRRLTTILPWSRLLSRPPQPERYPYLARAHRLGDWLAADRRLSALGRLAQEDPLAALAQANLWLNTLSPRLNAETRTLRALRRLVLVEGTTEALLLPVLMAACVTDPAEAGLWVHPVGGKNAMVALYASLSHTLACPILVLLDSDATEAAAAIAPRLRPGDDLFVLPEGELEDLYPAEWLLPTLNRVGQPHPSLEADALHGPGQRRVEQLRALWRFHQWGAFDKTELTRQVIQTLEESPHLLADLPPTLRRLLGRMHPAE